MLLPRGSFFATKIELHPPQRLRLVSVKGQKRSPCKPLHAARGNGNGVGLSGAELMTYITQTEQHVIELNSTRVKLLEELSVAQKRIKELEAQVEELQYENDELQRQRPVVPQMMKAPMPPPRIAAAPPAPAQSQAAPPATVTVLYQTGWENTYIHYQLDGGAWTQTPGVLMDTLPDGSKSKTLAGKKMEFVLTNGKNDWDTPNPYRDTNKPNNYRIDSPGVYRLKSGRVEKIS